MTEDEETPRRFFRTGITLTINQSFFAVLVIADAFGIVTIDPNWKTWIIVYIALNLLVYPVIRKQFLTPKAVNPKCNFCGGIMHATALKCDKCGSESQTSKR